MDAAWQGQSAALNEGKLGSERECLTNIPQSLLTSG